MSNESFNDRCMTSGGRDLVNYWMQARGIRDMPKRADIDAAAIRAVLPHVQVLEVIDGGRRFYTRTSGSATSHALGYDPTGLFLDEYPAGTIRKRTLSALRQVVGTAAPAIDVATTMTVPAGATCAETVMLPLSRDGQTVEMVLCASFAIAAGADDLRPAADTALADDVAA